MTKQHSRDGNMRRKKGCNDTLTSRYDTYRDTCFTIRYVLRYAFQTRANQ